MSLFRTEKNREKSKFTSPGSKNTLNFAKRTIKKLVAWFSITVVYGVIYSQVTQGLLDYAIRGEIGFLEAFSTGLLKSIQYGLLNLPEMLSTGVNNVMDGFVITAMIENFMPIALLYMANFYIVSIFIDVLDGREGEVVRYWVQALMTVIFMVVVSMIFNGFVEFTATPEFTFNATEIVNQTGGNINGSS